MTWSTIDPGFLTIYTSESPIIRLHCEEIYDQNKYVSSFLRFILWYGDTTTHISEKNLNLIMDIFKLPSIQPDNLKYLINTREKLISNPPHYTEK